MRVLLLTGHYKAGPGGAETAFFPPSAGEGARTEPGARFAAIYSRPARRSLEALIRYARPDVAHVHHIFELLSPSVLDVLYATASRW